MRRGFPQLRIASAHIADLTAIQVGDPVTARVEVDLGSLSPADVVVEMLLGHAADNGDLENRTAVPLTPTGKPANGVQAFEGTTRVEHSGHYACGLRVRPAMASSAGDSLSDLVLWACPPPLPSPEAAIRHDLGRPGRPLRRDRRGRDGWPRPRSPQGCSSKKSNISSVALTSWCTGSAGFRGEPAEPGQVWPPSSSRA